MSQDPTDDFNASIISNKEKMLFENILNDFKIDSNALQTVSRSLTDYYFDITQTFGLESILVGKVFSNTQTVILFDAAISTGQKMDIYYRHGAVRRVLKFSHELTKWRTAFLDVSNLRDRLYKQMIYNAAQLKNSGTTISPEDVDELEVIRKIDEALAIATTSMMREYAE